MYALTISLIGIDIPFYINGGNLFKFIIKQNMHHKMGLITAFVNAGNEVIVNKVDSY